MAEMETVESLTEDDMLCAWVEAEMDSPRYRADYDRFLDRHADLTPAICRAALGRMRGYPDQCIFLGLPLPLEWSRIRVTVEELGDFRYLNYLPTFVALSGGTRIVRDGAANVETVSVPEALNERILQTEAGIAAGDAHRPLIAMTSASEQTPILLEGNTRATAYVRCRRPEDKVELILGTAADLSAWAFV
jgi:hypothetical protein